MMQVRKRNSRSALLCGHFGRLWNASTEYLGVLHNGIDNWQPSRSRSRNAEWARAKSQGVVGRDEREAKTCCHVVAVMLPQVVRGASRYEKAHDTAAPRS